MCTAYANKTKSVNRNLPIAFMFHLIVKVLALLEKVLEKSLNFTSSK